MPKPYIGILITNFNVLLQAVHWLALKYIYILYPGISGVQILLFRNVIAILLVIVYINKGIKNAMWDSLLPGSLKLIFVKATIELILRVSMYVAIKYFTVTTFAVFSNMAPMVTVLLGAFALKEEVNCTDYCIILLGFASVTFITLGMAAKNEDQTTNQSNQSSKKYA